MKKIIFQKDFNQLVEILEKTRELSRQQVFEIFKKEGIFIVPSSTPEKALMLLRRNSIEVIPDVFN